MHHYSKISTARLKTCHKDLQQLFNTVIKHYDCSIVQGTRNKETQNKYYESGKSKLKWPKSKHNSYPSRAVDVVPYVNGHISWDSRQVSCFAGFVLGVASQLNINIRWGGDWDQDKYLNDNKFNDLVHFELK